MSETDTAIIQWAARHAPDVTDAEIAVSLGVPMRTVQTLTSDVPAESGSKLREYRRIIGVLTEELSMHTKWNYAEIAEVAGCTRQHLHRCRQEAKRGG